MLNVSLTIIYHYQDVFKNGIVNWNSYSKKQTKTITVKVTCKVSLDSKQPQLLTNRGRLWTLKMTALDTALSFMKKLPGPQSCVAMTWVDYLTSGINYKT